MLEQMAPAAGDTLLDPSCGDGEFLIGAAKLLVASGCLSDAKELTQRLIGFDINPAAVAEARARLAGLLQELFGVRAAPDELRIYCQNALDFPGRDSLEERLGRISGQLYIVGNPPYVEAKRLPAAEKAQLRKRYPSAASGAPDLYLYFLHACLEWLRDGDRLALVLPNRILVNTNGRALRERMLDGGQLWRIDFATRTQIFPGAAVYPVVLYGANVAERDDAVGLATIVREDGALCRSALPSLPVARYLNTRSRAFFPTPELPILSRTLERLLGSLEAGRLNDVLDVRWSVSFHRQGLRERYVRPSPEGMQYPQKFLGGGTFSGNGDVQRYRAQWSGWWIDYDAEALRAEQNQLPPLDLFQRPKIAICQNGRTLRAAFEEDGLVLKDTLLSGVLRATEHPLVAHPRALVALLSSRLVHFYYSHVFHGGHMNGGYLHFLRSFLDDIPLGNWTETMAATADDLVRRMEALTPGAEAQSLEAEIEELVALAFGLDAPQSEALREWAAADENWQARDRIRRRPQTMR